VSHAHAGSITSRARTASTVLRGWSRGHGYEITPWLGRNFETGSGKAEDVTGEEGRGELKPLSGQYSWAGRHRAETTARVTVVHGPDGLRAVWPVWNRLRSRIATSGFYRHPEWYRGMAGALEPDPENLYFFHVRGSSGGEGLLPLRYDSERRWWLAPLHRHVNLYDAVADAHLTGAGLLDTVLASLQDQPRLPWDRMVLARIPLGGVLGQALGAARVPAAMVRSDGNSAWFDLEAGEGPLAGAAGAFRRNLRRLERRLEQRGRVALDIVEHPGQILEAWSDFLGLEASGWKGARGTGSAIVLQPDVRRFYEQLLAAWGPEGKCRIHLLRLDGRVLAAHFAVVDGDTLSLLKIAYDELEASLAPGLMLLYKLLHREWEQKQFRRISLVTDPPWAERWGPRRERLLRAVIFNRTLRGGLGASWEGIKRLRRRFLGRDDTVCSTLTGRRCRP